MCIYQGLSHKPSSLADVYGDLAPIQNIRPGPFTALCGQHSDALQGP